MQQDLKTDKQAQVQHSGSEAKFCLIVLPQQKCISNASCISDFIEL